ncbi:hypothetical protein ACFYR1_49415 [Streptomyces canus]|uniref:hypothetical protein n=1 Tax=Streptomyces canus TaxID=58343 RepID=UPI0036A06029
MLAKDLRVSERSVERRRRAWREGGMDALASAGPKLPKLSDERVDVMIMIAASILDFELPGQ